jgi:hypothetical protein
MKTTIFIILIAVFGLAFAEHVEARGGMHGTHSHSGSYLHNTRPGKGR